MVTLKHGKERVRHLAHAYLDLDPDPIPRLRLLRDVLHCPPHDTDLLDVPLHIPVSQLNPRSWHTWFICQHILSHFASWQQKIKPTIMLLWSMMNPDGFWDLGSKASPHNFHLSESWRKPVNRLIDQSLRVLLLMERYYSKGE